MPRRLEMPPQPRMPSSCLQRLMKAVPRQGVHSCRSLAQIAESHANQELDLQITKAFPRHAGPGPLGQGL